MFTILTNNPNPKAMLIASRALAAARPSLIAFLIARGAEWSGGVPEPISFCNILFVGNLCAAIVVGSWFGFGNIVQEVRSMDFKAIVGLFITGCLATLLATLIFIGLQDTSVTNAVLLGRFGPVLYALAGALLLGKTLTRFEWFGFSLILVGVFAIVLKTNDFQINQGDLLILASGIVFAGSSLITKYMFKRQANLGVSIFSRNFISSIIFFTIAMQLFGPHHFADAFSGRLWIIMSVYALIVIVLSQFLWYSALEQLDAQTVGRLTVTSPIFGVIYAFFLNGEKPTQIQVLAFVIIIGGVVITGFGKKKTNESKEEIMKEMANDAESAAAAP